MLLRSKRKLPEIECHTDDGQNRDRRRLKLEPSTSKNIPQTYKSGVLKLLCDKSESNQLACELRMCLFVAAAKDYNNQSCLIPFPPCFLNSETKLRDYEAVTKAIDKIPNLVNIKESTDLPDLTWELLDWVFNYQTTLIEPLITDIPSKIHSLRRLTKLKNLPTPDNTNIFMFKITHTQPNPEFITAKKKFGSKFGFHGSSGKNFHSILHRGLMCSLNVQSAFGHGTYMSTIIDLSASYSYAWSSGGWTKSLFGNTFRCIAIVEVAMSSDTRDLGSIYVCDNDDHMKLSHLILYRQ